MAQSLGRKLRRGKAIAYRNGNGQIDFWILTKHWRWICNFNNTAWENKIEPSELEVANLKPIVKRKGL